MHFDQRTQQALREAGLSDAELREAADRVAELVQETADDLRDFFASHDTVYSDMDQAHSAAEFPEHTVDHLDCYTHGADLRGYLRFDTWGVPIEDGRVLEDGLIELTLGPTVDDRVRFAADRDRL